MIAFVLALMSGLLWLWTASSGRPNGPGDTFEQDLPAIQPRSEVMLEPARTVPRDPKPADPGANPERELEPFVSVRTEERPFTGNGTLRGHVEIAGEEAFPITWRLLLRPSRTLPRRETAIERATEFDDGRQDFELRDLPLGGYDVFAEASGFNGQVLPVLLEPGSEHPFVNLILVPAGTLEGRVFDANGVPAEGITLTIFAVEDNTPREARSDRDGLYRFGAVPDGAYELLVGQANAPLIPERRPLRFQAPHLTFPDIELPPLGEIHVRVVDSLARPLEGVLVRGSGTNGGIVEGLTDSNGTLVTRHLPPGHFRLRLEMEGLGKSYEKRVAVDVTANEISPAPVRLGP